VTANLPLDTATVACLKASFLRVARIQVTHHESVTGALPVTKNNTGLLRLSGELGEIDEQRSLGRAQGKRSVARRGFLTIGRDIEMLRFAPTRKRDCPWLVGVRP